MSAQVSFGIGINCSSCCTTGLKQLIGSKLWVGFPQQFNFPGFKDNWSSGVWTNGGNFVAGDLATLQIPSGTSAGYPYPSYYTAYICIQSISGSTSNPASDKTHFSVWDYTTGGAPPYGGPSSWPAATSTSHGFGVRQVWSSDGGSLSAKLTLTTTTDIADPSGTYTGTYVNTWTFPHIFDSTQATIIQTGPDPSTFPQYDFRPSIFFIFTPFSGYTVVGGQVVGGPTTANTIPALVSITGTSSSLTFVFIVFPGTADEFGHNPGPAAPCVVTQTITLSGGSYTAAQATADALKLREVIPFSQVPVNQSWTVTLAANGNVIHTINNSVSELNSITQSSFPCAFYNKPGVGPVETYGTPISFPNSINAVALAGPPLSTSNFQASFAKAEVPVTGNYCTLNFNCPVAHCSSGTGSATLLPTTDAPNTAVAIYASCHCT